ncbi:MAG: hypothetical protein JNL62_25200, partial [Bryobacterales bacterium]|nr:hypothetical protein [Bryobacterales bacterium]
MVVAQRSEPKSFHPVFAVDEPSRAVIGLLFAPLVRIHPQTHAAEGVLAERWQMSRDGRAIEVTLRRGLRFSDGTPLTADDVVFTYGVHLDAKVASPQQELLRVAGQPIQVAKTGDRAVVFRMAAPSALGERLLAAIPILPRHVLAGPHQ